MTTQQKVDAIIRQATALPEDAQAELLDTLVEIRAEQLGIYHLDEDERAALSASTEDERQQRYAPDDEIEEIFSRHGA